MTEAEENIYFKVESFVEIWFRCFFEDIRLPVVLLEVAAPRVGIEEIDQGVGVLTPLPIELGLAEVNIETASPVVDLPVL